MDAAARVRWQRRRRRAQAHLVRTLGGRERTRVILLLACVLALSGADTATVGASATQLRHALHVTNTDIGLLVTVSSLVAALASVPFGVLADRVRRTTTLGVAILFWGVAMLWSATAGSFHELLLARLALGGVTAAAGPLVASLVGDYFADGERGRVYGYILSGELVGAGIGFGATGDIATFSWRAAFVVLALPALVLAVAVMRLREPARGASQVLIPEGAPAPPPAEPGAAARPPGRTDAQHLALERGVQPAAERVLHRDPRGLPLLSAARYVLRVPTNVVLIAASACGYYFMAGVQTFGLEFTKEQYGVNQFVANLLLLVAGAASIAGVLTGGALGDRLLRRRVLGGRVVVAAVSAALAVLAFIPALTTRSLVTSMPYLMFAAFLLSAQNPPLDAARLDIMPPLLWGRAESIRTLLRALAQALAPLLFGAVSDYVFGGGRAGLQWTFAVMLVPLAASAAFLFRGLRTYPVDVATAAAAPPPTPVPPPGAGLTRPGGAPVGFEGGPARP